MVTTTVVERMPQNWDAADNFGDDWGEIDPSKTWREMFQEFLAKHYPHCSLAGDEIYGPATYRFPDADVQKDTPKIDDLEPLPDDSIYSEFQALHENSWSEDIEKFANR
jgi:hypothetical protein